MLFAHLGQQPIQTSKTVREFKYLECYSQCMSKQEWGNVEVVQQKGVNTCFYTRVWLSLSLHVCYPFHLEEKRLGNMSANFPASVSGSAFEIDSLAGHTRAKSEVSVQWRRCHDYFSIILTRFFIHGYGIFVSTHLAGSDMLDMSFSKLSYILMVCLSSRKYMVML